MYRPGPDGRHCPKASVEHKACEGAPCPKGEPSFRDLQCMSYDRQSKSSLLTAIINDGETREHKIVFPCLWLFTHTFLKKQNHPNSLVKFINVKINQCKSTAVMIPRADRRVCLLGLVSQKLNVQGAVTCGHLGIITPAVVTVDANTTTPGFAAESAAPVQLESC